MIPSGGLDMTCRRCAGSFHVDMPERTQAGPITLPPDEPSSPSDDGEETPALSNPEPTAVGAIDPPLPQNVEPTRIGVVTPFAESESESEAPKPESLLSPSGQIFAPTARFEAPRSVDTKPDIEPGKKRTKTPVTHGRSIPPAPAEMGLDSELDDTQRLSPEDADKLAEKQQVSLLDHPSAKPNEKIARDAPTDVGDLSQGSVRAAEARARLRGRSNGAGNSGAGHSGASHSAVSDSGASRAVSDSSATGSSGASGSGERQVSVGAGPNGLYERVAAGVYIPEEPQASPPSNARVRAKSWDEPSAYLSPNSKVLRALEPLRRAAVVLNGAPLAFKVALVVFPLTLGLALMVTSGRDPMTKDPVEIKVPTNAEPEETQAANAEEPQNVESAKSVANEGAKQAAKQTAKPIAPKKLPELKKPRMPGDAPAPEGRAYVQMERARLRSEPSETAEATGRLELGQIVRTYDRVDAFVLVMAEPKGPAGFISEKLIDAKKPIALLAKEIAFQACEVTTEYTKDDCLYQGKQQHDACIEACGVAISGGGGEDSPTVRCAEACKVAFNECQRSCNGETDAASKKKKAIIAPARATRTVQRPVQRPR